MADSPALVLYRRAGCHLCDETRAVLDALLARRRAAGLSAPALEERDIDADADLQRRFFDSLPVVEHGGDRLELAISPARLRRFLERSLDGAAGPGR